MREPEKGIGRTIGMPLMRKSWTVEADDVEELTARRASWRWPGHGC